MIAPKGFVVLLIIAHHGSFVHPNYILSRAISYAIASSFSNTSNLLHVVIETDFNENKQTFFDVVDSVLGKNWNFRQQIDVNNKNGRAVSDHNLWFIDSYEAFRRLLPWIRDDHNDSQLFYFIVLRKSKFEDYLNTLLKIFSDFLELMVANVNVVIESASDEVLFYTFFPYEESACRSAKPRLTHRFKDNSMMPSGEFFPPKANNFHECPLRIRTRNDLILTSESSNKISNKLANYEMSFLEFIMVKEFARRMNFTLEFDNITFFPPVYVNETLTIPFGPYELMSQNLTDVVIGFFKNNNFENRFLSKSVTYYFSWLVICLRPRPNTLRMYGWLFVPFNTTTWIYTVVFFTLITGCMILARRIKELRSSFGIEGSYPWGLEMLSVIIGTSVGHLSRRNALRFAFIVLSSGTLIIRAAYQGKLFDAYRGRIMLKSPHNIQELFAENYTIYCHKTYQSAIIDLNGGEYPHIENLDTFLLDINLFDTAKRNAVVSSFIVIYTYYTEAELKKLLLKPIFIEQICMFFRQHSVIQPRFNELIMQMEESGILHYLRKNYEIIEHVGLYQDELEDEPKPLVLERFMLTFYVWIGLCAVSSLVFAAEFRKAY